MSKTLFEQPIRHHQPKVTREMQDLRQFLEWVTPKLLEILGSRSFTISTEGKEILQLRDNPLWKEPVICKVSQGYRDHLPVIFISHTTDNLVLFDVWLKPQSWLIYGHSQSGAVQIQLEKPVRGQEKLLVLWKEICEYQDLLPNQPTDLPPG